MKVIYSIDFYASLIGAFALLFFPNGRKKNKNIVAFIGFQAVLLSVIFVLGKIDNKMNNIWLYQINAFVSCLIIETYFIKTLKVIEKGSVVIGFIIATFLLGVYIAFFEDRSALNSYSYGFVSLIISFLSLRYYLKLLQSPLSISIFKTPDFWFVTGLLLYYSLCMFIFLPYKIFTQLNIINFNKYGLDIWATQNVIYSIQILLFIKGLSCTKYYRTQL